MERPRPRPDRPSRRGLGRGRGARLPPEARLAEAARLRRRVEGLLPPAPATAADAVAPRLPPARVPEGGPSVVRQRENLAPSNRAAPSRAQRQAVRLQASAPRALAATLDASFGQKAPKAFSLGGGPPRAPRVAGTLPHGRPRASVATGGSPPRPVVRGGPGRARVRLRAVGEPRAVAASVRVLESPPGAVRVGRRELRAPVARGGEGGRASALPRGLPAQAAFAGSLRPGAKVLREGPAVRLASSGHGRPATAVRRAASLTRAGAGPPEEPGGQNPRRAEVQERAPDGRPPGAATAVVPRADAVRQDPAGGRRGAPGAKHESPRRPAAVVQPPRTPWTTDS
jgi:hypothetical protein